MGQPFKGVATYQTLRTISRTNKKYKACTAIIKVYPQDFKRILGEFKDIPSLRYRKTWVKKYPTEAYFLLAKNISQLIKENRHVILCNKSIKSLIISKKHGN